jgi:hypothetical protein
MFTRAWIWMRLQSKNEITPQGGFASEVQRERVVLKTVNNQTNEIRLRRITNRSNRLRAAVMPVAYATATPVRLRPFRAGRAYAPSSRFIGALYGQSLQVWPKGPLGASPAVESPRGKRKLKICDCFLCYTGNKERKTKRGKGRSTLGGYI